MSAVYTHSAREFYEHKPPLRVSDAFEGRAAPKMVRTVNRSSVCRSHRQSGDYSPAGRTGGPAGRSAGPESQARGDVLNASIHQVQPAEHRQMRRSRCSLPRLTGCGCPTLLTQGCTGAVKLLVQLMRHEDTVLRRSACKLVGYAISVVCALASVGPDATSLLGQAQSEAFAC